MMTSDWCEFNCSKYSDIQFYKASCVEYQDGHCGTVELIQLCVNGVGMIQHMMLFNVFPGPIQQNGLDPTTSEIQKLQNHIQQLEYNVKAMATVSLAVSYAVSTNIQFLKLYFQNTVVLRLELHTAQLYFFNSLMILGYFMDAYSL